MSRVEQEKGLTGWNGRCKRLSKRAASVREPLGKL